MCKDTAFQVQRQSLSYDSILESALMYADNQRIFFFMSIFVVLNDDVALNLISHALIFFYTIENDI